MKVIERLPKELLDATNKLAKDIEWSRRKPVYEIHKWWARRYSAIVRLFLTYLYLDYDDLPANTNYYEYVQKLYVNPPNMRGLKLIDPFCGGGTILFEASRLGIEAYGIEINRLAYLFLEAIKQLKHLDVEGLIRNVKDVADKINNKLWTTKCKQGHRATIIHTFLVWKNSKGDKQIKYNILRENYRGRKVYYCDKCGEVIFSETELKTCPTCSNTFDFNNDWEDPEYIEIYPYAIEYYCPSCNTRDIKKPDKEDLQKFNCCLRTINAEDNVIPIPKLSETRRLLKRGFKFFQQLLTPRQNATFKLFLKHFESTPYEKIAEVMVSDALRSCSLLAYYSHRYGKVIPGFVIKSYWLPLQPVELNPLSGIFDRNKIIPLGRGNLISSLRKIVKAHSEIRRHSYNYHVYNGAAQDLLETFNEKFDIVFTDPPYADLQYYSDLSLFSLSILGKLDKVYLEYLVSKEIVARNHNLETYLDKLKGVFTSISKVVKEDGWFLITFHHSDPKVVEEFTKALKHLNRELIAVYPVLGESSGGMIRRNVYIDLLYVLSGRKRNKRTYWTKTDIYFTEKDRMIIDSIEEIIEGYHG